MVAVVPYHQLGSRHLRGEGLGPGDGCDRVQLAVHDEQRHPYLGDKYCLLAQFERGGGWERGEPQELTTILLEKPFGGVGAHSGETAPMDSDLVVAVQGEVAARSSAILNALGSLAARKRLRRPSPARTGTAPPGPPHGLPGSFAGRHRPRAGGLPEDRPALPGGPQKTRVFWGPLPGTSPSPWDAPGPECSVS